MLVEFRVWTNLNSFMKPIPALNIIKILAILLLLIVLYSETMGK
jgi:hypothetical protein